MTFEEYQKAVLGLAIYRGQGQITGMTYATLGLAGESGEVAEKVKKLLRGDGANFNSAVWRRIVARELGDVLWYCTALASELGYTLEQIAEMNLEKLTGRKERGTLRGDGDDR